VNRHSGYLSLIGFILIVLVVHDSRAIFDSEDGPFLISGNDGRIMVELGNGFGRGKVHQFIDGTDWLAVIKMTNFDLDKNLLSSNQLHNAVEAGRRIDLIVQDAVVEGFSLSWMTAGKRLALGISLHPDRMTETDWLVLPGIGENSPAESKKTVKLMAILMIFQI